jgi:signal transduction histidine kinase
MQISIGNTYTESVIYSALNKFFSGGIFLLILPILLIEVFKRKIRRVLLLGLSILYAFNFLLWFFIPQPYSSIQQFALVASFIFVLGICFYYIITSWKSLMGAQWAIVVGLIFSIFSLIAGFILELVFKNLNNSLYFGYQVESCFILSFPLSLLAYVSIRFKEIINEVGLNAKRVIELSEEKKVQAENQQKVLQDEVNKQTSELRNTLENLRSAQSQLIQSEKMASLGELTAGIAHEIQNPLNFVNNFSEVNKELLVEMNEEIEKGNLEEVKLIAKDVTDNEEKIIHHGKRADAIVKGMLQHSRSSTGKREPTNINALADEYLRLSYHGLRAKDKEFNASMKTDFDQTIGNINIIPQDIGRVLLNLYNNAFYAVTEKMKQQPEGYEPTVSVSTKKVGGKVEIKVSDNGNGIPQKIVDKIFQPFFTTKPTGVGTGLGLSLSYDIVKAHGGEIKVNTIEKEFTEFVVQLPVSV